MAWTSVACQAPSPAPRSFWAGQLVTPQGPLGFGLELAEVHGGAVVFWNAGTATPNGVLEYYGGTRILALASGQRLELRGAEGADLLQGEWRNAGPDPLQIGRAHV